MYKIIVEKITETEYPEVETVYFQGNKKAKSYYLLNDKGEYDSKAEEPTGRMLKRTDKEAIFEQTLEDLNVKALAVFLNQ